MSNQTDLAERIGSAWQQHREGRSESAISEFETILRQNPDDIDANYGIGLAQRAAGRADAAIQSFQTALQLVNKAKTVEDNSRSSEQIESNIKTPEDDRLQMLTRMIQQRITETQIVKS